jgi:hypothetical protein
VCNALRCYWDELKAYTQQHGNLDSGRLGHDVLISNPSALREQISWLTVRYGVQSVSSRVQTSDTKIEAQTVNDGCGEAEMQLYPDCGADRQQAQAQPCGFMGQAACGPAFG